ncbi:hypothetical protein ACFQGA_11125 [Marinobacter koreensis]|uniref:Single Cache domain-containing protein n=1 Tax=Marinobacter koreensis TaxID=335974 RepID=A0ABW0RH66_9GAMM|nr:hypothetical protein [Marinobacter koreensis]MCK7548558.1 hypothetical protein [Marinobacter koreensis]
MQKLSKVLGAFVFCFSCVLASSAVAKDEEPQKRVITTQQLASEIQANTRFLAAKSLKKAKSLLETYGDFAPFGAALFPSGKVRFVWAIKPGELDKDVNPVVVLNAVRSALKSQADNGRILGSAVVYKFQPDNDRDGKQINVELEYMTGFAEVLGTQYQETADGFEYGEGAVQPYDPVIFKSDEKPKE